MIAFTVYGIPQPAGSKRAFIIKPRDGGKPRAIVTDANANAVDWKNAVAATAMATRNGNRELLACPLRVAMKFYRPRPKSHYNKQGYFTRIGNESLGPTGRPDVLKLARGTEDALTGVLWRDDAQIVEEHISKVWGEPARCEIEIEEI